jgi:mono/diheme cytochrome c family protein
MWAMPVVAALPVWAFFYSGAFGERATQQVGLVAQGATVYRSAGCGGCHGPTGGGGVGPAMGGVNQTFPEFGAHVDWIKTGSKPFAGQPYGAEGTIASGNMPGFEGSLTEEQIIAVTCYERVTFGGAEPPPECAGEGAEGGGGGGH